MNQVLVKIVNIETNGKISFIEGQKGEDRLFCFILEAYEDMALKKGQSILFVFKESEVMISKGNKQNLSVRNQFRASISRIEQSCLLTRISLQYQDSIINSLISTQAAKELALKEGDSVIALVKSDAIAIMEP